MFELTFEDTDNSVIEQLMVRIGSLVEVYGGVSGIPQAECLIKGEVTSIEGEYHGLTIYTIIRGYEKSHRLQRSSRTRTFVDMKDSDIASKIAREAGFMETDISDTSTTHRHVSQISQTDWDFLRGRAQEIGFETGVAAGQVLLPRGIERQARVVAGGIGGAIAGAAGEPGRWRAADAHVPAEPAVVPTAAQRGQHPVRRRGPRLRLREGRGRRRHRAAEDRHGQARRRSRSRGAGRIVHRAAVPDPDAAATSPACRASG